MASVTKGFLSLSFPSFSLWLFAQVISLEVSQASGLPTLQTMPIILLCSESYGQNILLLTSASWATHLPPAYSSTYLLTCHWLNDAHWWMITRTVLTYMSPLARHLPVHHRPFTTHRRIIVCSFVNSSSLGSHLSMLQYPHLIVLCSHTTLMDWHLLTCDI